MPVEYMGLFGLTWEEKVASFMKSSLKGTAVSKKLNDFWQSGGLNVRLVKNLYNEYSAYQAKGYKPVSYNQSSEGEQFDNETIKLAGLISQKTNVDNTIVLSFLKALYNLSRDGKIPFEKWNPSGFKESTALRKSFDSEKGILDIAQNVGSVAGKNVTILLIVLGVGASAYLLHQIEKTKKVF